MNKYIFTFFCALFISNTIHANGVGNTFSVQRFNANSLSVIEERYRDKHFIMVLWSLECPPCFKELDLLSRWQKDQGFHLVLINIDAPELKGEVEKILEEKHLHHADSWQFDAGAQMKLRYSIDPQWYGELPRSYFYQTGRQRQAVSGLISEAMLKQWLVKI